MNIASCHIRHLKTFVTFVHAIQGSHVCSIWLSLESSKVKWSLKKIYIRQIPDGNKIESPYTENHIHMQIITSFANFTHVYRFRIVI